MMQGCMKCFQNKQQTGKKEVDATISPKEWLGEGGGCRKAQGAGAAPIMHDKDDNEECANIIKIIGDWLPTFVLT